MWTRFMDRYTDDGKKEAWDFIYIEADRDVAIHLFRDKFGHDPLEVKCAMCGRFYAIVSESTLAQVSGFERGCRVGLTSNTDEKETDLKWLEEGDHRIPLDEWLKNDEVAVFTVRNNKLKRKRH